MKTVDPNFEMKVLQDVIEQLEDPAQTIRKQVKLKKIVQATGYIGILIAFMLALDDVIYDMVPTFIAAMSGCAIGFGLVLDHVLKQWPVTIAHVDLSSVQARLDELGDGSL